MSSKFTKEQLVRIEENRRKALEKRALREKIEEKRRKALETLAARNKERINTSDVYRPPLSAFKLKGLSAESSASCERTSESTHPYRQVNVNTTKTHATSSAAVCEASNSRLCSSVSHVNTSIVSGLNNSNISTSFNSSPWNNSSGGSNNNVSKFNSFSSSAWNNSSRNSASKFNTSVSANSLSKVTGGCRLVSSDRFIVDVGYHAPMLDIFKSVQSALYDSKTKRWTFRVTDHDRLMKELRTLKEVSISGLPKKVLDIFLKPPVDFRSIELSNIDPVLIRNLMPFQKEGVQYGISRKGRCLIADDMGLGKTIQALGIAHYYLNDWPLLIVCPTSVRFQWLEAVHSWLPSVNQISIFVMTSKHDFDSSAHVLITSYNLVSRHVDLINSCNFGVVILDESHFLKAPKAARTKSITVITKKSRRIILLSGTPALSRPVELFTQLQAVDPITFSHFQDFGIRYCAGKCTPLGFWDYSGASNMEELQLLLERSLMIRRLKSDVLTELPSKMRQMIVLSPRDISQNKEIVHFENALQDKNMRQSEKRGTLLQYYSVSGMCKLPAILAYVDDKLESGQKFLIFAHHQAVLDAICECIMKKKISYIRIDGKTSSANRKDLCDKFQYDENCLVAVLSITAANAGITLTAAQLVIFAELFWNPGVLTQAEDRAHRIGQQDCVLVQYLVAPGTADDHLWPLIQAKLNVLSKAGLSKDNFQNCSTSAVTYEVSHQKTIKDYFSDLNSVMNDDNDEILLRAVESVDF